MDTTRTYSVMLARFIAADIKLTAVQARESLRRFPDEGAIDRALDEFCRAAELLGDAEQIGARI